jgi:NADH-quinone oxidoreductase subunit M
MSKAGVFGFIAWVLPIFPLNLNYISGLMWLGLGTAIYGALMALRATDGKRLLAYSSMSHLGFAVAGVFSLSEAMLPAVLVLLVAHGISAGVQYFLMGVAERMTGTRNINEMGGLSSKNPVFSFLFGAAGVMALAVPGTAGFVGEFTVLLSLWDLGPLPALVGGFCLILSATYVLRFVQKVIFGKPAREYQEGTRTTALEGVAFGSMLALLLAFGLHPAFVTNSLHLFDEGIIEESTTEVVEEVAEPAEQPMTAEELRELDSTLAASGFTEEERKALLAQIQSETLAVDSAVAASEAAEDSVEAQGAAEEQAAGTDSSAAGAESPAVETEKTEASENE